MAFPFLLLLSFLASQTYGATVTNVEIRSNPTALPGGQTTFKIKATITGVLPGYQVSTLFDGDTDNWINANLPLDSQNGIYYVFAKSLIVPKQIGVYDDMLWWIVINNTKIFSAQTKIEVTCSDGIFCNGEERYANNKCAAGLYPCNDNINCTTDICSEVAKNCTYFPEGLNCPVCTQKKCTSHCWSKQQCGDDGCGGSCGSCAGLDQTCVNKQCAVLNVVGSCLNPDMLFGNSTFVPDLGIVTTIFGSNVEGIDLVTLPCGQFGVKEYVYQLTISPNVPVGMGFDIQSLSSDGNPNALDTVIGMYHNDCTPIDSYSMCSDDATPPGGLGSRIFGKLTPGQNYKLVISGYSSNQLGPFQLKIKFVPNCVPQCDGSSCGSDGCGGDCGTCITGEVCTVDKKCAKVPCTPSCQGRQCGSDGCGGICGSCKNQWFCIETRGKCKKKNGCDGLKPVCNGNGGQKYCGSDCLWHSVDEHIIDLIPAPDQDILPTIKFQYRDFGSTSCAISEHCVPFAGKFLLMTFDTDILNIDAIASFTPDPFSEFFEYAPCHQHYHFDGFAEFSLFSWDETRIIIEGSKRSYCMEDTRRTLNTPAVNCAGQSTCENQGISAGFADVYTGDLDCQWLVVNGSDTTNYNTGIVFDDWYKLRVCTNIKRNFAELSYDNNCKFYQVYIPS